MRFPFSRKLIQFSEDLSLPVYNGVVYAFFLLVISVVKCLLFHHMIIIQDKQGQCVSTAMMAMVYKKVRTSSVILYWDAINLNYI